MLQSVGIAQVKSFFPLNLFFRICWTTFTVLTSCRFVARLFLFFQMVTVFPLLMYILRAQTLSYLFGNVYPRWAAIISSWTRMHSSGMRTVRCSGRLPGGVSAWRVSARGGLPRGSLPSEVSACGGVSAQGRGCLPRGGVHLPPVDRQTLVKTWPFPNYCCGR